MRISLMIEGQEGVGWDRWIRLASLAERHGFDALMRSDHALSIFDPDGRGSMDAWTTIAGLAAVTGRIRLGTLVSPIGFRHPALLARIAASADQISGGRIEIGIGAGWYEREHIEFGYGFDDDAARFARLAEYLEIVDRLLTGDEPTDHHGEHYLLNAASLRPRPVQRPRPAILMGGVAGPKASSLAARFAQGYNVYDTSPEQVAPKRDRLDAACEAIGRDPATLELSINGNVLIGADASDLRSRARRHAAYQGADAAPDAYLESLDPSHLVGTPEAILERLEQYARAGIGRVMMQVFPHDDDAAIELIGEHVIPPASALVPVR